MNVIDPAQPASQFLDRGSSTTYSSLVLTNARISARSTVVSVAPSRSLSGCRTEPRHPVTTECGTARPY
jgi:hypothetical protein